MPLKIAILASGSGTNAQAIIDKARSGLLDADIKLIFSNRPEAQVLKRAAAAGIASQSLDHAIFPDRKIYDQKVADIILEHDCEFVALAGYMRLISPEFLNTFRNRVINIHPALLPSFPGTHGARDALAYGAKLAGASIHFVEEKMDSGPLVIQAAAPVHADDTEESLQNRIHTLEHRIYPQALQWFAEGRISIEDRKVRLAPGDRRSIAPDGFWLVWPPLEEGF